jgi:hypothetical protein
MTRLFSVSTNYLASSYLITLPTTSQYITIKNVFIIVEHVIITEVS